MSGLLGETDGVGSSARVWFSDTRAFSARVTLFHPDLVQMVLSTAGDDELVVLNTEGVGVYGPTASDISRSDGSSPAP